MKSNSQAITQFHRALSRKCKRHFCCGTTVSAAGLWANTDWQNAPSGVEVSFHMLAQVSAFMEHALRGARPGTTPVVLLRQFRESPYPFWAGWYEEWEALGDHLFALRRTSWAFYAGGRQSPFRGHIPLVRAEWDSVLAAGYAAQPHWHIDRRYASLADAPDDLGPGLVRTEHLQELPISETPPSLRTMPEAMLEVDASGVHLPMGGWRNPVDDGGGEHQCWQCRLDGIPSLLHWAVGVFAYMLTQLRRVQCTLDR